MQGGTLRGIGVTSPKRNELTPDLPALAEAMPGFEATIWYGLLAPANTPDAIINKLYAESEKFLTMPETREKLANVGVIVSHDAAGRIRQLHPQRNRRAGRRRPRPPASSRNSANAARRICRSHAPVGMIGLGLMGTALVRAPDRCRHVR